MSLPSSLSALRNGATGSRAQVLRLVHNASLGLPTTSRAAALWAREFSGAAAAAASASVAAAGAGVGAAGRQSQPIILRRQTSHAAQSRGRSDVVRTYGAAAHALADPDDSAEYNHRGSMTHPSTRRSGSPPGPAAGAAQVSGAHHPSHRQRRASPSSSRSRRSAPVKSVNGKPIPQSAGQMRLPSPLYHRLLSFDISPSDFRDAFASMSLQYGDLGHMYVLQAVWGVWLGHAPRPPMNDEHGREVAAGAEKGIGTETGKRTEAGGADPSLWAWLGGQLGHLLHDDLSEDVRALSQAIRAYALIQLGQTQEARLALEAGLRGATRSPLTLAIRSLALGSIGERGEADRALALALRRTCSGDYTVGPGVEQTLGAIWARSQGGSADSGRSSGRGSQRDAGELLAIIRDAGKEVRTRILGYAEDRTGNRAVQGVVGRVMDVLAAHEDPCGWLLDQVGTGHAQGQDQDQGQNQGASQHTRWMGAVLLASHIRALSPADTVQSLLSLIQSHHLPLPAALHLDALLALADSDVPRDSAIAVDIYRFVKAHADDLSHLRLSNVLHLATRKTTPFRELGQLAWEIIEWRFAPLPSDRHRAAMLGLADDVDVLKGRIERTIGSLDHPDALDVLLTKYILVNDILSAQATFDSLIAIRPGRAVYDRMLAFYAAHARADDAIELFDAMLSRGIQPTLASLTSLIALFANRRDVENAQNVFNMLPSMGFEPDAVAWTAILNAEVEAGEWSAAAVRWAGMPEDMKRSQNVLGVVLKAYVQLATPTARVLDLFESVPPRDRTGHMWSLVIQSAVDDCDFALAEDLFARMLAAHSAHPSSRPAPSVFHYSILLYGYMQADQQLRAKEVYNKMLDSGIIPTSVTYGMMLSSWRHADGVTAFAQASKFAASVFMHAKNRPEAPRARGETMENIYGPLISLSGNIGDMETAEGYLKLAAVPAHTPLRDSDAVRVNGGEAGTGDAEYTGESGMAQLSTMTAADVEAHFSSDRPAQALSMYTRLLDAYRRSGRTDSVLAIWDQIFSLACRVSKETTSKHLSGVTVRRSQDNVLCIPLSIVLDSLGSAGRLMDVRSIWDKVGKAGFGFDAQNYNHYAVALARTGDVERAFAVVEDVLFPRWREVMKRQTQAMRLANDIDSSAANINNDARAPPVLAEHMDRIALEEGNSLRSADIATQPAQRPPNRRSEQRWAGGSSHSSSSSSSSSYSYADGTDVDVSLLKGWRTTDILWRPSTMTISVLEHVWKQLQEAKSRSWFVLADGGGEAEAEAEDEDNKGQGQGQGAVTLPAFGDVPVRDANGEISKASPGAIIMRLNKRYVKTVALIMFHKRKRHAAQVKARRGG